MSDLFKNRKYWKTVVGSGRNASGQGGLQHFKRKKATDGRKDKIMGLTSQFKC